MLIFFLSIFVCHSDKTGKRRLDRSMRKIHTIQVCRFSFREISNKKKIMSPLCSILSLTYQLAIGFKILRW